jgi:hypothetical protein
MPRYVVTRIINHLLELNIFPESFHYEHLQFIFVLKLSRTLQPKHDHVTDLSAVTQFKQCAQNVYTSTPENE